MQLYQFITLHNELILCTIYIYILYLYTQYRRVINYIYKSNFAIIVLYCYFCKQKKFIKILSCYTMKERIEKIMQKTGLSSAMFAKMVGLKQAALSHILTGRNNPSLDVIMKINQAFPYINLEWLLYGKGEMGSIESKEMMDANIDTEIHNIDNSESFPSFKDASIKETIGYHENDTPSIAETIKYIERPCKKIIEIRIFYDDGTYETFASSK